jgi:hypothetical protein
MSTKMNQLDDLEKAVLAEAANAKTVQDMSVAATALKTITEARNALNSEQTAKQAYQLERTKVRSTFLVPVASLLASLLAIVATVYFQQKQLATTIETTRQQIEDSEWRDLLSSLKGSSDAVYTDLTIAPRLTSFASSPTHGNEAKQIATRFMGHLSNVDGFRDLFGYVFPAVNNDNIQAVLDVARSLTKSKRTLEEQCDGIIADTDTKVDASNLFGCGEALDDKSFQKLIQQKNIKELVMKMSEPRKSLMTFNREADFLGNKLVTFLRLKYNVNQTDNMQPLNLSNIFLFYLDFSNLNLSKFNIAGTIFDTINLERADLRTSLFNGVEFRASNWWDVQDIDPKLLVYAAKNYPTYNYRDPGLPTYSLPTLDDYKRKVKELCLHMNIGCEDISFQQK